MNIVLLLNSLNVDDIRAFVTAAAELQEEKAPGAMLVVYQQTMGKEFVEELAAPLMEKMSAGGSIPVPINEMMGVHGRTSSLFCRFVSHGYALFPGPWLMVDGPGVPTRKNFVNVLERQHGGLGGTCSGRFSAEGIAQVPIGPMVLGVPVSALTWFNGGGESWRSTMRFMFRQQGFKVVPLDEYLFSLPSAVASPAPPAPPVEPPASPSPPVFDPACLDQPPVASPQPVAPQPEGDADTVCPNPDTVCPDAPGQQQVRDLYGHLERDELLRLIAERPHLEKPHHSTGRTKLLAILVEDDETIANLA